MVSGSGEEGTGENLTVSNYYMNIQINNTNIINFIVVFIFETDYSISFV